MDIYLAKDGQQTGPYSLEQIQAMVNSGQTPIDALGWHDGLPNWVPLSAILPAGSTPTRSVPPALPPGAAPDFVSTRKTYLSHEASVRSIGTLYYLCGFFSVLAIFSFPFEKKQPMTDLIGSILAGVFLAVLFFWLGSKLKKLDPAAKVPVTILACLGLLACPFGTIINAFILYLLHSEKGKMVFSTEYQEIIAATPDIKYKTSIIIWILLILLLLLIVPAIIYGLLQHH